MCGRREFFVELNEEVHGDVSLGDSSKLSVEGKGRIKIFRNNGKEEYISDVYYIPSMKSNILSIGQLLQKRYVVLMENNSLFLKDASGRLIAKVPMTKNRMFPLNLNTKKEMCFLGLMEKESWKWHFRFGHLHFNGLKLLSKGGMPISFGGNKYFITFIDDYSRKVWVYFLKEKSSAFNVFKNFKARTEVESKCKLVTLRSDRGGEYTSNAFQEFCKERGIKHQLTAAYTPQQNGIAERKNRTILEMTRSMLKEKSLPKQFWAEAVQCSVYLLNRCPTKSVKNKTPQEAWSGYKPNVAHLRIFGCVAYAQVPKPKGGSLMIVEKNVSL
ncbi:unnamed protein product [Prunus brigantina]